MAALGRWVDPKEVYARGQTLGEGVDHQGHGVVVLAAGRPTVREFVQLSNGGRLPELVPLRVGQMLASPFAFFRGSAALMAGDLTAGPCTGLDAQLCGDAHAGTSGWTALMMTG